MKLICVSTGVKNESDFLGDGLAYMGNLEAAQMNPISDNIKLGMFCAVMAGMLIGYSAWAKIERNYGRAQAVAEYAAVALAADQAAREKEHALQAQITKAENDAQERQKINAAAATGAARAVVSLRTQLAAARAALPIPADAPSVDHNAASDAVLAECGDALIRVAKAADGHSSDAVMLLQAWPK